MKPSCPPFSDRANVHSAWITDWASASDSVPVARTSSYHCSPSGSTLTWPKRSPRSSAARNGCGQSSIFAQPGAVNPSGDDLPGAIIARRNLAHGKPSHLRRNTAVFLELVAQHLSLVAAEDHETSDSASLERQDRPLKQGQTPNDCQRTGQ